MKSQYIYDVAISFAEEDHAIASGLASTLEAYDLSIYYYKHQPHITIGTQLETKLPDIYENQARFCVAIISQDYVNKTTTLIEYGAVKSRREYDADYLIPVKVGDVKMSSLDGLTKNTVYHLWKGDFKALSQVVLSKVFPSSQDSKPSKNESEGPSETKSSGPFGPIIIGSEGPVVTGPVSGGIHFGSGNINNQGNEG